MTTRRIQQLPDVPFLHALQRLAEDMVEALGGTGRPDRPLLLHLPHRDDFDPRLVGVLAHQVNDLLRLTGLTVFEGDRHDGILQSFNHDMDGLAITAGENLSLRLQLLLQSYQLHTPPFLLVAVGKEPRKLEERGTWMRFSSFFYKTFRWPRLHELCRDDRRALFSYGVARRALELGVRIPNIVEDIFVYLLGKFGHEAHQGACDLMKLAADCTDAHAAKQRRQPREPDRNVITFDVVRVALAEFTASRFSADPPSPSLH